MPHIQKTRRPANSLSRSHRTPPPPLSCLAAEPATRNDLGMATQACGPSGPVETNIRLLPMVTTRRQLFCLDYGNLGEICKVCETRGKTPGRHGSAIGEVLCWCIKQPAESLESARPADYLLSPLGPRRMLERQQVAHHGDRPARASSSISPLVAGRESTCGTTH